MHTLKFVIVFLLIGIYSCGQNSIKQNAATAKELNQQAMNLVRFIDNTDSAKKAISLLEQATSVDSNNFSAYYNKMMFYNSLKKYDKAILTINKLIQLRPNAQDLYLTGGMLYEQIGDTVSSKAYFQKSLAICNSVLDTMNLNNPDYTMLVANKAVNLIMLSDTTNGNVLLKKLYDNEDSEEQKKEILSLMNKSKKKIVEQFVGAN